MTFQICCALSISKRTKDPNLLSLKALTRTSEHLIDIAANINSSRINSSRFNNSTSQNILHNMSQLPLTKLWNVDAPLSQVRYLTTQTSMMQIKMLETMSVLRILSRSNEELEMESFYWLKISIKFRLDFKVFYMYDVNFVHCTITSIPKYHYLLMCSRYTINCICYRK